MFSISRFIKYCFIVATLCASLLEEICYHHFCSIQEAKKRRTFDDFFTFCSFVLEYEERLVSVLVSYMYMYLCYYGCFNVYIRQLLSIVSFLLNLTWILMAVVQLRLHQHLQSPAVEKVKERIIGHHQVVNHLQLMKTSQAMINWSTHQVFIVCFSPQCKSNSSWNALMYYIEECLVLY